MTRDQTGGGAPSPWALAAITAAFCFFCPLATIAAPILALRAFADIRRNPWRSGRRFAIVAMVMGVVTTLAWVGAAVGWHVAVRVPMRSGLETPLRDAYQGDVAAWRAAFDGPGTETTDTEIEAFVSTVRDRFGAFGVWTIDGTAIPREVEPNRPIIPYAIDSDRGRITAEACFVVSEPGRGFVRRFRWVRFDDPDGEAILFPRSLADEMGATERSDDEG